MQAHDGPDTRRRSLMRRCDACNRSRELQPVTLAFSPGFDGPFRLHEYIHICADCHGMTDTFDEMIGPALRAALCTMLRALGRKQ